jgi:hypothetical protein
MYSWTRFDEPSYDGQSEYFARYKPRFATSSQRYWRAKWSYVGAITLMFLVFSLVPELFIGLAGIDPNAEQQKLGEAAIPLAVALALITLENTPGLKDIERRIRGFLHAFARIPGRVRRSVAQMRSSPFNFTPSALSALTRKLGLPADGSNPLANLNNLLAEDDLLHSWYSIGALLCALSEKHRDRIGIDPLFFDSYRTEFESISDKYIALTELVRQHVAENSPADAADSSTLREIRDLRDRLYTFIACGVHSNVKSDAESLEIIKKLGFAIRPINRGKKGAFVAQLAGLAVIVLIVISIFTGCCTQIFREHVLLRVGQVWIDAFPVPKETLGFFTWSWTTALFYLAAIIAALAIRNSRVARRQWFDITDLKRERPILSYVTPTLAGTALGSLTLFAIAVIGGPGFRASSGDIGKAAASVIPWIPLATVMGLIAITLSDSHTKEETFWRDALRRSAYGACAMAVIGFGTSHLSISPNISAYANDMGLEITSQVTRTGVLLNFFIAAQIGLFAFALCVIAQVAERYTARARCFSGQDVEVVTRQGAEFRIHFDPDGTASLFPGVHKRHSPTHWRGRWQLFPEGTAIKWSSDDESHCTAGEFGLISWYGDSLIYEGYIEGFAGTPDFLGQVRAAPESSSARRRQGARSHGDGPTLAPTGADTEHVLTIAGRERAVA